MRKALALRKETLTELSGDDLAHVVGGTTMTTVLTAALTAAISKYIDVSTPTIDDTCIR